MERIKALNGYTIYRLTERDEKHGKGYAGEYNVYFSSDIRDYGVNYSDPVFDGLSSLEEAVENITGDTYAIARELCENETTAVTEADIEAKQAEIESGNVNADEIAEIENVEIIPDTYEIYKTMTAKIPELESEITSALNNKGYTVYTCFLSVHNESAGLYFIDIEYGNGNPDAYRRLYQTATGDAINDYITRLNK